MMKVDTSSFDPVWHKAKEKRAFDRFVDQLHAAQGELPIEKKKEELKEPSQQLAAKALGIELEGSDMAKTAQAMLETHGRMFNESDINIRNYIKTHFPDDPEGWRKVPNELTYFPPNISEEIKQVLFEYKQNPEYRAEEYVQFYWMIINDFSGFNRLEKKLQAMEASGQIDRVSRPTSNQDTLELMKHTVMSLESSMAIQYFTDLNTSQKKSTSPETEIVKAEFERGKMVQQMMQQILQKPTPTPMSKRTEKTDSNVEPSKSPEHPMTVFMANFMTQFQTYKEYMEPINLPERLAELRAEAVDYGDEGRRFFPGDPKVHYTAARKREFLDKIAATLV